jgi:DNA-binding transcriptional ArsR family regulator
MPVEVTSMRDLLAIMKALADENRLRIVAALQDRELCLCQLVELLGLATSTVSRHASILQQARVVESRKQGRWTYFRLSEAHPTAVTEATSLVVDTLKRDPKAREDRKHLKQILRIDPEELCRKQSECKC